MSYSQPYLHTTQENDLDSNTTTQRWNDAKKLLDQQDNLRGRLKELFLGHVTSGMYDDEPDTAIPTFVNHVRRNLALSPRTVLRQALEFAASCGGGASSNNNCDQNMLFELKHNNTLGIFGDDDDDKSMHALADAMKTLSPGQTFRKRERILKSLKKLQEKKDSTVLQEQIAEGVRRKLKKNEQEDRHNNNNIEEAVVKAVLTLAARKESERIAKLKEEAEILANKLETDDPEYLKFQKAQRLYKNSGAKQLWEKYTEIDLAICRNRGRRGMDFERKGAKLCFEMITLLLLQKNTNKTSNLKRSEFSFQQNFFWWQGERRAGEIDLAILYEGKVIAVCEMKSSCFEIQVAVRQHESKLQSSTSTVESSNIGPTAVDTYKISPECENGSPYLYVTTILPNEAEWMIGAEPVLVNAVCEGIRAQSACIVDSSTTDAFSRQLAEKLWDPLFSVHDAIDYLDKIPPAPQKIGSIAALLCDSSLDYKEVERYVKSKMGPDGLRESPVTCLKRCHQQILILPSFSSNCLWVVK